MAKLIKRGERFGREPEYVATTLSGLEAPLAQELTALGALDLQSGDRAISFRASKESFYRLLLRSRLAIRIFRKLSRFHAGSRDALYEATRALSWEQLITPSDTFAIRPQTHSSLFKNARFASQVVKDAIVDRQRNKTGRRSSVYPEAPDLQLQLRILGQNVELLLDASGEPLSKRGYRKQGGLAPMNEVLAAGLLELSEWDKSSPLVDPFCGSGTILAEAAIKVFGLAPNAHRRRWAHLRWPDHDAALWNRLVEEARVAGSYDQEQPPPRLVGVDISEKQLAAARENLRRLGVLDSVKLLQGDARELDAEKLRLSGKATIITNIPYGERTGGEDEEAEAEIESLYRSFGDWLKQSPLTGDAWVLTGNLPKSRSFGLRSSARIELYNGPIECRLLHFELY